ncbi:hypothetical protein Sgly_1923 [Syntrophobotulus glycolicus DSM 8271]|uniref:Uncharacterized protein n=1 Tax=Syntrophobotulus glycolicus (strain DSM 8271 / FlGlyR) TaxID=645991 RepID=F0T0T0_SYNGF|nr:hypothetical protein [Syntrophobotulus glycolicus]ADY56219.1 hypothetical protein Sgly_1923 [Syntrophobotulus glycolicus DSM 8271]
MMKIAKPKMIRRPGKRTCFLLMACLVPAILICSAQFILQPLAKQKEGLLQEKEKLLKQAQSGNPAGENKSADDEITSIVSAIKEILRAQGVLVKDMSLVSAAENTGDGMTYSKASLNVQGSWTEIMKALETIGARRIPAVVQEVDLGEQDSQVSLEIFYRVNERQTPEK